jgi:hypothetical protein
MEFRVDKTRSKMFINRTIINNPRTADVVAAAAADTYLNHAVPGQAPPVDGPQHVFHIDDGDPIQQQKVIVGNLLNYIKRFNDIQMDITINGQDRLKILELEATKASIRDFRERLWNPSTYDKLTLNYRGDTFLEVLLSNIKGSVISFQTWTKRLDTVKKNILINEIQNLKKDFFNNSESILQREKDLCDIIEAETVAKVRNMKIFDCLNSEKPTPMFLSLARVSNSDKRLSDIKDARGNDFNCNKTRDEYITKYFETLYKKDLDEPPNFNGCIERFLGDDIINNPIVQNSKLSEAEHELLDAPLTVDELDKSINNANMKSAPGIDGMSNIFLREFWLFIRLQSPPGY